MTSFLTLLSIGSFMMSSLLIFVFIRNKHLQNSQSYYKISIAVSDVIVALFVIPSILYNLWFFVVEGSQSFSESYRSVFGSILFSTALVTLYSFVFAAADRLFVVLFPMFYKAHDMKKISKFICLALWCSCAFVSLLPVLLPLKFSYDVFMSSLIIVSGENVEKYMLISLGTGNILVIIFSVSTFIVIRINTKRTKRLTVSHQILFQTEIKLTKNLLLMVFAFIMMTLPLTVVFIILINRPKFIDEFSENDQNKNLLQSLIYISYNFYICGAIWNFMIYVVKNISFRKALKQELKSLKFVLKGK